jgi:acetolactate synthase regulatory subunit
MSITDRGILTSPEGLALPGNGQAHTATHAATVAALAHTATSTSAAQRIAAPAAAGARRHVVNLYVSNKPGVLVRVALVFARLGCNIDGLVVSEARDPAFSHMTVTASGSEATLRLILGQLNRLVDVIHAEDHTGEDLARADSALTARGEQAR